MKKNLFILMVFICTNGFSQGHIGQFFTNITDTNAWKSEIRFGNIRGNIDDQINLRNALNAKEDDIQPGTASQYWRGDKTWQPLNKSAVGLGNVINITQEPAFGTGTIYQYLRGDKTWQDLNKASVGLGNVLNITQEPAISPGPSGTYWANDKTWKSVSSITGNFMLKTSPQGLQDTSTHSKIFFGRQAVNAPEAYEDYVTFDAHAGEQAFQLQYGNVFNNFWIRGRHPGTGVWKPWRKLVFSYDMDTANTRITNYINTQIGTKTATIGYSFTEQRADVNSMTSNLHKTGNVVTFNFRFYKSAADAGTVFVYLGQLPVGARPTQIIYGAISPARGTGSGAITIDTDGIVSIHCGDADENWYGNLSWTLFTN